MDNTTTWTLNMTQMLAAISDALDSVEGELLGASMHHAKRISCLCAVLGRELGLSEEELFDLAACALLHDNALPEYIATEYRPQNGMSLGAHCTAGEKNMKLLPVYGDISNVLLYHHENIDGTGPFLKRGDEIPLYAKLIHMTDILDVGLNLSAGVARSGEVRGFLKERSGSMFDADYAQMLIDYQELDGLLDALKDDKLPDTMISCLPQMSRPLTPRQVKDFSLLFADIVDYKSAFTARHSQGVAEKAVRMGEFYGASELEQIQLLLAGALHDIGKLVISNDILEKPGKLTSEEFHEIKNHAYATWEILRQIDGLGSVMGWSAYHHEKLDGSGYPFGLKADDLDRNARLMACIDIYQAMTEPRPYKPGLPHEKAMAELRRLSGSGKLDKKIVDDLNEVFGR